MLEGAGKMNNSHKRDSIRSIEFNEEQIRALFGHEAAEDETIDRLKEYYLKTNVYISMKNEMPLLILAGHKGVGKSALLKVLSHEDRELNKISITVQPNDILRVDTSTSNFLTKIEIWKDGLSSIILNKLINYPLNLKEQERKFIDSVKNMMVGLIGKKITELQKGQIQLTSAEFISVLKNNFFKDKKVIIYIDDLDRGWQNSKEDIQNLSAMLNAVRDLSREMQNLKFRIALRSDVYYSVRTSDETTDKIDGSVIWLSWTNHEILVMLIKRIETFFGREVDQNLLLEKQQKEISWYLDPIFENRFQGAGHWSNAPMYQVIMSLIRKRPRDLVKLCTLAARKAFVNKHSRILTNDLESVFRNYSNDRLTDTSTEYQSELPAVKQILLKMKPSQKEIKTKQNPSIFTRPELLKKLEGIISMTRLYFTDGKAVTPQSLAAFLYKINFITARKKEGDKISRVYYDENQYIYNEFADWGYSYEIHPAYRWALEPDRVKNIFYEIDLLEIN